MLIHTIVKKKTIPYLFLGPAILLLVILMLYPMFSVIWNSFFNNYIVEADPQWVGLEHYKNAFNNDDVFFTAFRNTMVFTFISVASHIVIGLAFALLLNFPINKYIQSFFRVFLILPWVFTAAVVAINWRLLLNPLGIINYFLTSLGIVEEGLTWFGSSERALLALTIVNIWRGYPFIMVSLLAGLQGIPTILYEAATIDGANGIQKFFRITIPQLQPIILSIGLLDIIWTFRLFELVWLTTGGGPGRATETLPTYTYKLAFNRYQFSNASAIAVIILIVTMVLAIFYLKRQKMND